MKQSEFVRWLRAQGVHIEPGGKHLKLYYNGRRSHMPNHPNQELANGTMGVMDKFHAFFETLRSNGQISCSSLYFLLK